MSDIINVVVCYNNALEVVKYAHELNKLEDVDKLTLIIVINSASNEELKCLNDISSAVSFSVQVENPHKNLGYMKGLSFGYEAYVNTANKIPEFVIMSNTDIEIPDSGFLNKIINAKYDKNIWCIGPSVFTKYTHNYDNPVALTRRTKKEIDNLVSRFDTFGGFYVWLSQTKAKLLRNKRIKPSSQEVYEVHGCFFILTGDCAEQLRRYKFIPLMYSEETYIAEIVYKNGKKEYYDSNIEVIHMEHTSTSLLGNKGIANHLSESMKFIRKEFYEQ